MNFDKASRLTEKERRFAAAIASGMGPTAAYRHVYSSSAGNRAAQANGRQVAKRPRVIEEIERLGKYPLPDNFSALQEFAIKKLIDMAQDDSNPTVRHKAMSTLLEHADRGLRQPPPPLQTMAAPATKSADRAKIIAELRLLYQKAGVKRTHSAIDAGSEGCVSDSSRQKNGAVEQGGSQVASATVEPEALSGNKPYRRAACACDEEPRVGGEVSQRTATGATGVKFEWVNLPGYFGKSRRVRIPVG